MENLKNDVSLVAEGRLTKNDFEPELFEVSSFAFAWRLAIWLAMIAGGVAIAAQGGWGWFILGATLSGLGIAHGVELSHQALHNTGFRSPSLNEVAGVALGLPMLVSFYEYRLSHLKHHAKVGTEEDSEFFDYGEDTSVSRILFERFFMTRHYANYFKNLLLTIKGENIDQFPDRHQKKIKLFYIISALGITLLCIACFVSGSLKPIIFWLFALFLVAAPVHALIEFPEHYRCVNTTKNTMQNTRTITSNRFMRWFTNSNNFHVEHHHFPGLPLQNAHRVHPRFKPYIKHLSAGYRAFYFGLIKEYIQSHKRGPAK